MRKTLEAHPDEHWNVWLEWWEARRDGKPYNIDMEREIVLISDSDWEQGPAHVNGIIAEIRKRYEVPLIEDVPVEHVEAPRIAIRDGRYGVVAELPDIEPDEDQISFHHALIDDIHALSAHIKRCDNTHRGDPFFDRLSDSLPKFVEPLGTTYPQMKCGPLWIAARGLREVERFDRRMTGTEGEKSPLDVELAESLRTTVTSFNALCLLEPKLKRFEEAGKEPGEIVGISLEALEPLMAMVESRQDAFLEDVREMFDELLSEARSEIEGIATRGHVMSMEAAESMISRLVTDAIKEWRSTEANPVADSFKKKIGEQAASALGFSVKALVTVYCADFLGFTDRLPNADTWRPVLDKIIQDTTPK